VNGFQSATRSSLLYQLRMTPGDPRAWNEFVAIYVPKISNWFRRWGLQEADINDLTQDVLLALSKQMSSFEYDPQKRFRSWLKTIAHRAWVDFLKQRNRHPGATGSDAVHAMLSSVETTEDFVNHLVEECNRELLEEAMLIVRRRVQDSTWRAFEMTALEQMSGDEVSKQLGMPLTAIYKAKSRIQKLLKEEVERIDGG